MDTFLRISKDPFKKGRKHGRNFPIGVDGDVVGGGGDAVGAEEIGQVLGESGRHGGSIDGRGGGLQVGEVGR